MTYQPDKKQGPIFAIEHPKGLRVYLTHMPSAVDIFSSTYSLSTVFTDGDLSDSKYDPREFIAISLEEIAKEIRNYKPINMKRLI